MLKRSSLNTLVLLILTMLLGCGGADRIGVTGTVTVDGKPLTEGVVNFAPAPGTNGPSSGGSIADGRFEIPSAKGLVAGKYQVRIIAFRNTGRTFYDPDRGEVPEQVKRNFKELPLSVDISVNGDNHFELTLTESF